MADHALRTRTDIPYASEVASITAHTFTKRIHALYADAAGSCDARLRGDGDTDWVTYTFAAGDYRLGEFVAIQTSTFAAGELVGLVLPLA